MLHALTALHERLAPALVERLTLALNHLVAKEPAAAGRLRPHAGRALRFELQDWPAPLPPPPALQFRVSRAGLLEWEGAAPTAAADLTVRLRADRPLTLLSDWLAGGAPPAAIEGDARFAADVDWLLRHLRWDAEADLEPLIGPGAAHAVGQAGAAAARGLRGALRTLDAWRPGGAR